MEGSKGGTTRQESAGHRARIEAEKHASVKVKSCKHIPSFTWDGSSPQPNQAHPRASPSEYKFDGCSGLF